MVDDCGGRDPSIALRSQSYIFDSPLNSSRKDEFDVSLAVNPGPLGGDGREGTSRKTTTLSRKVNQDIPGSKAFIPEGVWVR